MLSVIEQLESQQEEVLRRMEPKLRGLYGVRGSWIEIVKSQMNFPDALSWKIRSIWQNWQLQAKQQGIKADPNEFAKNFVDENFSD